MTQNFNWITRIILGEIFFQHNIKGQGLAFLNVNVNDAQTKEKNKDTAKGDGEGVEGGLVDLGLDDENAEKKLKQIYEEEKRVKDILETTNKHILKKECDILALLYSRSENAINQAKRDLATIQVKRATKQQKQNKRLKFNITI